MLRPAVRGRGGLPCAKMPIDQLDPAMAADAARALAHRAVINDCE
ncbi:MAG: hypothetical protein ACLR8Y_00350 [Alistipes indistinctus]